MRILLNNFESVAAAAYELFADFVSLYSAQSYLDEGAYLLHFEGIKLSQDCNETQTVVSYQLKTLMDQPRQVVVSVFDYSNVDLAIQVTAQSVIQDLCLVYSVDSLVCEHTTLLFTAFSELVDSLAFNQFQLESTFSDLELIDIVLANT